MNSLEELNDYGDSHIIHGDERPFAVTYYTPGNQGVTIDEGDTHEVPVGKDILTVQSVDDPAFTYTVDISSITGATLEWDVVDDLVYTNPSAGVYVCSEIYFKFQWDAVKNPTVTLPADYSTNSQYTGTLTDPLSVNYNWFVNLTINDLDEIDTVVPADITYDEDIAEHFGTDVPQITDLDNPGGTYNVTIVISDPSAGVLSTVGTGGTSVWNTDTLTIEGLKADVNEHLYDMTFTPANDYDQDFTLLYTFTNPSTLETEANQNMLIGETHDELAAGPINDITYDEDGTSIYLTSTSGASGVNAHIVDLDPSGTYTVTITISDANAGALSTTITGNGTANYNSPVMTITGNKAEVNHSMDNLKYTQTADYELHFTADYHYTKNATPAQTNFNQNVLHDDPDVSTFTDAYGYVIGEEFELIYFIDDTDGDAQDYTLTFNSPYSDSFYVDTVEQTPGGVVSIKDTASVLNALTIKFNSAYHSAYELTFSLVKETPYGDKVLYSNEPITMTPFILIDQFDFIGGGDAINQEFENWYIAEYGGGVEGPKQTLVFGVSSYYSGSVEVDNVMDSYGPTPTITLGNVDPTVGPCTIVNLNAGTFTEQTLLEEALATEGGVTDKVMFEMGTSPTGTGTQGVIIIMEYAVIKGTSGSFDSYTAKRSTLNVAIPYIDGIWHTDGMTITPTFEITDGSAY